MRNGGLWWPAQAEQLRAGRFGGVALSIKTSQPLRGQLARMCVQATEQAAAPTRCAGANTEQRVGALQLIVGPMFAGKTTELLRRVQAAEAGNLRVAVLNSSKDTRYGENVCASHDGLRRPALAVSRLSDLLDEAHPQSQRFSLHAIDVVAIDESQFFPPGDLIEFCVKMVEDHGKTVIVAGLNGDFKRQQFGDILHLVPLADHVDLLSAKCAFCEQKALFTLRVVANDSQQLVGGSDKYSPVCRQHYRELNKCRLTSLPSRDAET